MTNAEQHIRIPRELYGRIVQAKCYLDENYASPVRLEDAAAAASISSFHFLRLFKKAYRVTPHQYLTSLRVQQARKLLSDSQAPIAEICMQVGFSSEGSFASLFKRQTGCTPARYRQRMQERKHLTTHEPARLTPACFLTMYSVI